MLSGSTRNVCSGSKTLLKSSGISNLSFQRFQSTQSTQTITETIQSIDEKPVEKRNNRNNRHNYTVNPLIEKLDNINKTKYTEFYPMFEEIQNAFETYQSDARRTSPRGLNRIGNLLLTKIINLKKEKKINAPTSTLLKDLIQILSDSKTLHVSHFNRFIESLLIDGRYMEALTLWVNNAGYFKDTPSAMFTANPKFNPENDYHLTGLSTYLLSLIENNENKIDNEFIKLIYGENKKSDSLYNLSNYLRKLNIPENDLNFILPLYKEFKEKSFDINSEESLKGIRIASVDGKIVYLEETINKNLKLYENKPLEIKPSTIAYYMKYLNHSKLYSKCIEIWKFSSKNKIEINIEIWNQLLFAFSFLKIDNLSNKIESIWKILNNSLIPNSESYSIYIQYLIKANQNDKVKLIINDLRNNKPELFDSNLKCSLIQFLCKTKKIDESFELFNIYSNEENFKLNIETFNILFTSLINESKLIEANELLNNLINNKYNEISPDIATWTKIIDLLMKNAKISNLSRNSIIEKLSIIIEDMIKQNVKFNTATLSVVATNLFKNYKTQDLGLQILKIMDNVGVKLNDVAYSNILTSFTNKGDLTNALYYFDKALINGIKPGAMLYNSILKGYSLNPNITETLKFLDRIEKIQLENPNNLKLLPNKYTFFYLLTQGISVKDDNFVKVILEKLNNSNCDLGTELPKILQSLKESGYEIPSPLINKI
ncbi:hypothetical protein DAPK24_034230 [Pichia kluyveri]|uniref:Mitochondrial 15S rRNA processing factor CCM1 n=1 Tax=Pichia kluyveri TaxID=36015 RepID=A0AAV5R615_PICKL|nr:hypothetical protein DAPK24_034230 [Pichia kluyveri]